MSQTEGRETLKKVVLDKIEEDDITPTSPKEEARSYPTSVRIPVRLRAMVDDVRNDLYADGIEFTFNNFIVWCIQLGVEYTIRATRMRGPKMHQFVTEMRMQRELKMDKEDYDAALAFTEETLKDLERTVKAGDLDRGVILIAEMERGANELQGWRRDVYERAITDRRVDDARRAVAEAGGARPTDNQAVGNGSRPPA